MKTQIVILGGGAAGLELAKRPGTRFGCKHQDIILVDRNRIHGWLRGMVRVPGLVASPDPASNSTDSPDSDGAHPLLEPCSSSMASLNNDQFTKLEILEGL